MQNLPAISRSHGNAKHTPGCMPSPGNRLEKPAPSLANVAHTLMVSTPCGCSLAHCEHPCYWRRHQQDACKQFSGWANTCRRPKDQAPKLI